MFILDGKTLPVGVAFTHDGVQYPANWLNLATPEEKAAIGIAEVQEQTRPDDRYYWVGDNGDGTYTATPKDLDQLKADITKQINAAAYTILQPSDYIDTRNLRDPSYKPEWMDWRASILVAARTGIESVIACESVEDLAALPPVAWPANPDTISVPSV